LSKKSKKYDLGLKITIAENCSFKRDTAPFLNTTRYVEAELGLNKIVRK